MSREACKRRVERFLSYLGEKGLKYAVVMDRYNCFYLTGFEGAAAVVIRDGGAPLVLVPRQVYFTARRAVEYGEVVALSKCALDFAPDERVFVGGVWDYVERELLASAPGSVGLDLVGLRASDYLKARALTVRVEDISSVLREMRARKDEEEIAAIRMAVDVNRRAMERALSSLEKGVTELDILAEINRVLTLEDAFLPSRVLFGERTAEPYTRPSARELREGDLVLIDIGTRLRGYCSDVTRTVVFGSPSAKVEKLVRLVKQAQREALSMIKPGVKAKAPDRAVREFFRKEGLSCYFNHDLGHGLGIEIREYPALDPVSDATIETGMVLAVEPGLYLPGLGGVRFEDDVLVTEEGCEVLSVF